MALTVELIDHRIADYCRRHSLICAGRAAPRGATPSSSGFRWRVCSSRRGRAGEIPATEVLEIELAPLTTTERYPACADERRSVYGEPLR